jgi:hypothetical protein
MFHSQRKLRTVSGTMELRLGTSIKRGGVDIPSALSCTRKLRWLDTSDSIAADETGDDRLSKRTIKQEYSNEIVKSCRNDRVASFGVEGCCESDVLWDGVCSRSELG